MTADARVVPVNSRAVLFDLFHTLVAIELHGPLPPETWEVLGVDKHVWSRAWGSQSDARLRGKTANIHALFEAAVRDAGIEMLPSRIDEAIAARLGKFRRAITEVDGGILQALDLLRGSGRKLGLVSNADSCEIAAWAESPLRPLFDAAVFSCEIGYVKPEPIIFEACCAQLGAKPDECVYVGDGGSNELAVARALGMYVVQTTWILDSFWPGLAAERGQCAHACVGHPGELAALFGATNE